MKVGEEDVIAREEVQLDGLGLVPGVTVLPHFERSAAERARELQAGLSRDATVLGVDGATGCFFRTDRWIVSGPGRVHVISQQRVLVVAHGGTFTLPVT